MNNPILACRNVSKTYMDGSLSVKVLTSVDLEINPGETIAVVGPSGSGKSTLLHLLGGLDSPTSGEVLIKEQSLQTITESERCRIRNAQLGFVYQFHHLLPEFTAVENVMMPLLIAKLKPQQALEQALKMLAAVGLTNRAQHRPSQLSGGERQRVAIARAVVAKPLCVLADEPTGNLDNKTANEIVELFMRLNQQCGMAFVIVTHDLQLAAKMDRQIFIDQGLLHEKRQPSL